MSSITRMKRESTISWSKRVSILEWVWRRVACLLQNVDSIFDCDIVAPIVAKVAALAGVEYGKDPAIDKSIRVIADHSRSITFMALDGILPGNEGRGYVLRRLLRRIIRHGHLLGMEERFQSQVIDVVIKQMAPGYPELLEKREYIHKVLSMEEERVPRYPAAGNHIARGNHRVLRSCR